MSVRAVPPSDLGVTAVDDQVSGSGWVALDLIESESGLVGSREGDAVPLFGRSGSERAELHQLGTAPSVFAVEGLAALPRRATLMAVPREAFVTIGRMRAPGTALTFADAVFPTRTANDNYVGLVRRRPSWREALFLAILVVTLLGAYLTGRASADERVIVVPAPSSFDSVIT